MKETFQPARASARQQEMDSSMLRERIKSFSRYFEPKHMRGPGNMIETLKAAKQEGATLASNREFDFLGGETKEATGSIKVWTGTLIIAQKEGKPFGEQITTSPDLYNPFSFVFVIPREFRGQVGGCIALQHPEFDFMLVGQNTYQVVPTQGARLYQVGRFPLVCGVYRFEQELGLTFGEIVELKTLEQSMKEKPRPKDMSDKHWKIGLERELESEWDKMRRLSTRYGAHICLAVRDLNSRREINISVSASEKLRSFVRASITPENYVQHVVAQLQQAGNEAGRRTAIVFGAPKTVPQARFAELAAVNSQIGSRQAGCQTQFGNDRELRRFVRDWMDVDPVLVEGIGRSGLLGTFVIA